MALGGGWQGVQAMKFHPYGGHYAFSTATVCNAVIHIGRYIYALARRHDGKKIVILLLSLQYFCTDEQCVCLVSLGQAMHQFATAFHHEKSLFFSAGRFLLKLQQSLYPGILCAGYGILCLHYEDKSKQFLKAVQEIFAFLWINGYFCTRYPKEDVPVLFPTDLNY